MDAIREQLKSTPDEQISETDPDARSMISQAKGTGVVGYNVQAAVDAKHHLIVTHEVTNVGNDRAQLTKMATAAKDEMGKTRWRPSPTAATSAAPRSRPALEAGITPLVPKPMTSNAKAEGRFSKRDFIYIAKDDEYQCPAGERAIYRFSHGRERPDAPQVLDQRPVRAARCSTQCTTSSYRRITRWEHERLLEAMQRRLDRKPEAMTLRRRTIEHVFGTLKHWMGSTHFLTRGLPHVSTEMSLHVLAYNLKRVIKLLGMAKTMQAMRLLGA